MRTHEHVTHPRRRRRTPLELKTTLPESRETSTIITTGVCRRQSRPTTITTTITPYARRGDDAAVGISRVSRPVRQSCTSPFSFAPVGGGRFTRERRVVITVSTRLDLHLFCPRSTAVVASAAHPSVVSALYAAAGAVVRDNVWCRGAVAVVFASAAHPSVAFDFTASAGAVVKVNLCCSGAFSGI